MEKCRKAAISLSSILLGAKDINGVTIPFHTRELLKKYKIHIDDRTKYSGGILTFSMQPYRALEIVLLCLSKVTTRQIEQLIEKIRSLQNARDMIGVTKLKKAYWALGKEILDKDLKTFQECFKSGHHKQIAITLLGEYYEQFCDRGK